MLSTIWTQCEGTLNLRRIKVKAWRCVEAQHIITTRPLVDTKSEHDALEQLIEASKPPVPTAKQLHYLLVTPFRYPPLEYGSRFGSKLEPSIWYGSERISTALAETAYYRLLFLEGTYAALPSLSSTHSVFSAQTVSSKALDLTKDPFAAHEPMISHPSTYSHSQALGAAMRTNGVELFLFRSARDPDSGKNVGLFSSAAFVSSRPTTPQTWHSYTTKSGVEFSRWGMPHRLVFERSVFLVDGQLPLPVGT